MTIDPTDSAFARSEWDKGLTKREYFAAQALSVIWPSLPLQGDIAVEVARVAVRIADALINELNKGKQDV